MDKSTFSERDICTKFITPAIEKAGWDLNTQPVPNIEPIKLQVFKDEATKETYKHESRLTLEHLFYGHPDTAQYFIEERTRGGGTQMDEHKKIEFARNTVQNLPVEMFEVFRPMFEFIKNKIPPPRAGR
ncbi:MAG: hypothetical protein Q8L88_09165 [Bacteroidota bacterium]|nr:hypothetical protein [Bacteroidota bacterium]